jgi:hypothetical protein
LAALVTPIPVLSLALVLSSVVLRIRIVLVEGPVLTDSPNITVDVIAVGAGIVDFAMVHGAVTSFTTLPPRPALWGAHFHKDGNVRRGCRGRRRGRSGGF